MAVREYAGKGTVPYAGLAIGAAILIVTRSAGIHWAGEGGPGLRAVSLIRAAV